MGTMGNTTMEYTRRLCRYCYQNFSIEILPYIPAGLGKWFRRLNAHCISSHIGKNLTMLYGSKISVFENVSIGNDVTIADFATIHATNRIEIGNDVGFGPMSYIITANHGHDLKDVPILKQVQKTNPLVICDGVLIGRGVVVSSGARPVKIAKGVIVGANSVVLSDCDVEYGIYCGIPARFVKSRFSERKK